MSTHSATSTTRIAIVGIGAIGGMHARAIGDLPNARLVAASCRTQAKGRKFAEEFGCTWYGDFIDMMERERPDVVTLCTPSGAHLEPALAAAERGIHVLCEKPLEITTQRCDQMIAAAKRAGIILGGIFPQRFNPVIAQAQQAAAGGRFGNLAVASCYVPWWREDSYYAPDRWQGKLALDGGGALMNQSIHGVDAVQWLAAAAGCGPVEQVFAFTAKRGHDPKLIEVEDTCVAVLRFANGALGQILAATSMWPGQLRRLQLAGRDGFAEVLEDQLITWRFRDESAADEQIRRDFAGASKTEGGASNPMAISYGLHTRNIAAFLEAIEGKSKLMLDAAEARKAVAIIEAIYRSAATAAPCRVE
jgi:UDP-N-acetyl-2-amino-2-deoxyglucuronate dehydrogenase